MAFGDILGGLIQGGAPLVGYGLGGPAGAAVGSLAGQFGGDIARSVFAQQSPQEKQLAELTQQMQNPYQFQKVSFDPIAQAEQRRFQQQIIPGIAERFTGTGGQRSSAFRQALGGAAGDLASRLAELRAGHEVGQQQAGMQAYGINQQRMNSLANLLQGQQQQQQAAREAQQNRYAQFAGAIPKTILDRQRLGLDAQRLGEMQRQNYLQNMLSGLGENRNINENSFNQLMRLSQLSQEQPFDVERNRIPSGWERAGNIYSNMQEKAIQAAIKAAGMVL